METMNGTHTREVTNTEDVIDSRDVIARIESIETDLACDNCGDVIREDDNGAGGKVWVHTDYLSTVCGDSPAGSLGGDDLTTAEPSVTGQERDDLEAELATLTELADEASDCAADWQYGETLIRDSYFVEYAQELAEDIGAISPDAGWPLACIDWEQAARELRMDYTAVDFGGVTYWIR